jgi:ATP-dependent phosphofructokinase / diphosphate-dependent phosphofructokinase
MIKGNCLVAQSGGPTAVINASACGVIQEAQNHDSIQNIYGAENGILGILNERLFDLNKEDESTIVGLKYTPSSALGTCRFKLTNQDEYDKIQSVFEKYNIRYFFYIGGNDSQDTANKIHQNAMNSGYDLKVIGVPKTVDNDLWGTDHCPGFGSVMKYTAAMIREVGLDSEASYSSDKVNIIETMGRNAGWIAAGTVLARELSGQAPDIILLPEIAFDKDKFIERVKTLLKVQEHCVIVVSEGVKNSDGSYLGEGSSSVGTDSFGHQQLGGASMVLKEMVETELRVKTRQCRPSIINRNGSHFASLQDSQEAYDLGCNAVAMAVRGETGLMVTLKRVSNNPYKCIIEGIPLGEVANKERTFPLEWITENGMDVKIEPFREYALPLIKGEVPVPIKDGLPSLVRLKRYFI